MKRIILASAILAGLASAASAQSFEPTLSAPEQQEVRILVGNVDLSNLSAEQVSSIQNALYGGGNKAAEIRAALN
ncbi:hypothetical protein V8J36_12165 [Frigidibacter sp. MR17.14]|uniref:hypothetical protein n=1 Tax=Frigidibacter sp. MR17.14 TaxID=3126509 RepID=UPI003012B0D9